MNPMEPSETPERFTRSITWYRTPLDRELLKRLHERSDAWGLAQSLGYLGVLVATGTTAWYSAYHWSWWATALLVFLHGTVFAFQINAVHELGHNTVFRTPWLGALFLRVFSFLGWINFRAFAASHAEHHRFTLHPPDDQEVVLPIHIVVKQFFQQGFFNWDNMKWHFREHTRLARGKFQGEWELAILPESDPAKRRAVVRQARFVLASHGTILLAALALKLWMLPVVLTLAPFYGQWLFFLCNNTQHIGLTDNVADFRLCCRTFTLNPVVQFLYWHMNFHLEHHMYAGVPCYRLGALHRAIKHDCPPAPHGIAATWREIAAIQAKQKLDPSFQYAPPLPN